jgi:hypothetical protein
MPVIAQLRGLFTQLRESIIAWLTQSAGHVLPEPTTQRGSLTSAETTHQPLQPVSIQLSQSSVSVRQTTPDQKLGSESSTAQQKPERELTLGGSKSKTPARQTRQPAKPVAKAGRKPAKRTSAAKSQK